MERPILHIHTRRVAASHSQVASAVDALYSDTALDAFPRDYLRPWRKMPGTAQGFVPGGRFGHGPLTYEVESWDGRVLAARMATQGFTGQHRLTLQPDGKQVVLTHRFDARLTLGTWLAWKLLFGACHDWAVESFFDRLEIFFKTGQMPAVTPTPPARWIRALGVFRRLIGRVLKPKALP